MKWRCLLSYFSIVCRFYLNKIVNSLLIQFGNLIWNKMDLLDSLRDSGLSITATTNKFLSIACAMIPMIVWWIMCLHTHEDDEGVEKAVSIVALDQWKNCVMRITAHSHTKSTLIFCFSFFPLKRHTEFYDYIEWIAMHLPRNARSMQRRPQKSADIILPLNLRDQWSTAYCVDRFHMMPACVVVVFIIVIIIPLLNLFH